MRYLCCVAGCGNSSERQPRHSSQQHYNGKFIKLPTNVEQRQRWNAALNISGKSKRYICAAHFADDAWRVQDVLLNVPPHRRRLKANAVPTLKLCKAEPPKDALDNKAISASTMDIARRKQLVAEALAAYEQQESFTHEQSLISRKQSANRQDLNTLQRCSVLVNSKDKTNMEHLQQTCVTTPTLHTTKCGEIMLNAIDNSFALNCMLCPIISNELEEFVKHVKMQHANLLNMKIEEEQKHETIQIVAYETDTIQRSTGPTKSAVGSNNCSVIKAQNIYVPLSLTDLNNAPLIERIISLWQQHPVLWHRSHAMHALLPQRKRAINNMLATLLTDYPTVSLDYSSLLKLLQQIRTAYRQHLRAMKSMQNYTPNFAFFKKLKFLSETQLYNIPVLSEQQLAKYTRIASEPPLDTTNAAIMSSAFEIIELYEQQPSLWNLNHTDYKGKLQNSATLQLLFTQIRTQYPQLQISTTATLCNQLELLQQWYSAEAHLHLHFGAKHESKCPSLYVALEFLQGHVAPWHCAICARCFSIEQAYLAHTRNKRNGCADRLNGVIHQCEHCGKRFALAASLKRHQRIHTDERPYECQQCSCRFRNYSTWFRHKRTHSKVKPFRCRQCERCFYTSSQLRAHQQSHLGIREQVCEVCGKAFTLSKNLYRHRAVHLKRCLFKCKSCGCLFKTFALLSGHSTKCSSAGEQLQQSNQVKTIVKLTRTTNAIVTENYMIHPPNNNQINLSIDS